METNKRMSDLAKGDIFRCEYGMEENVVTFEVVSVLPSEFENMVRLDCKRAYGKQNEIVCGFKNTKVIVEGHNDTESVQDFVKRVCDRMDYEISEIEPYAKDGAFHLCKRMYVKQILDEEMNR